MISPFCRLLIIDQHSRYTFFFLVFCALTCCCWHPKVVSCFNYNVNPNTTKSVGWEEARDRRREHFNGLCIPRSRQLSLLFRSGDHMSGYVAGFVPLMP